MYVSIHRNETSQPIEYKNVINSYTKGNMYCVMFNVPTTGSSKPLVFTHKYPLCSIFRVVETDGTHSQREASNAAQS